MLNKMQHTESYIYPINKKFDIQLLLIAILFLGVIVLMLYLLNFIEETSANQNFRIIFKSIMYGVGSIMFVGFIYELFKKEQIIITRYQLIHTYILMGINVKKSYYEWEKISELTLAPVPNKEWHKTEDYSDFSRTKKTYTKEFTKSYPVLQFYYDKHLVQFANGLQPAEAESFLKFIDSKK